VKTQDTITFREVQKIPIWVSVIVSSPVAIIGIVQLFSDCIGIETFLYTAIVCLLLAVFLLLFRLDTVVSSQQFAYRLYPLQLKFRQVSVSDVKQIRIRRYRPIAEYGGWGIRFGRSGSAVNLKGDTGVQIIFNNGKKLLVGTSKPGPLEDALAVAGFTLSP